MSTPESPFHVWDCERMLGLRCPRRWDSLGETEAPNVRHCPACDKHVYLCRTPADFVVHGEQGHCVAIPDDLSPHLGLGEPSPEEVLRTKALVDRGLAWWDRVDGRRPALGPEQKEAVRASRESLARSIPSYSEEHLAILRLAVQSDGVRCPRCGFDIAQDHFEVLIFLATRRCERCQEPIDLDLSAS
jgi:hypothetical protein